MSLILKNHLPSILGTANSFLNKHSNSLKVIGFAITLIITLGSIGGVTVGAMTLAGGATWAPGFMVMMTATLTAGGGYGLIAGGGVGILIGLGGTAVMLVLLCKKEKPKTQMPYASDPEEAADADNSSSKEPKVTDQQDVSANADDMTVVSKDPISIREKEVSDTVIKNMKQLRGEYEKFWKKDEEYFACLGKVDKIDVERSIIFKVVGSDGNTRYLGLLTVLDTDAGASRKFYVVYHVIADTIDEVEAKLAKYNCTASYPFKWHGTGKFYPENRFFNADKGGASELHLPNDDS